MRMTRYWHIRGITEMRDSFIWSYLIVFFFCCQTNRFVWLDGSHWTYADWLSGEPNHTAGVEDCLEVLGIFIITLILLELFFSISKLFNYPCMPSIVYLSWRFVSLTYCKSSRVSRNAWKMLDVSSRVWGFLEVQLSLSAGSEMTFCAFPLKALKAC